MSVKSHEAVKDIGTELTALGTALDAGTTDPAKVNRAKLEEMIDKLNDAQKYLQAIIMVMEYP